MLIYAIVNSAISNFVRLKLALVIRLIKYERIPVGYARMVISCFVESYSLAVEGSLGYP